MRPRSELDREFEDFDRECSIEEARIYRELTEAERLAHGMELIRSGMRLFGAGTADPTAAREEALRSHDREKDEVVERLARALD